MSTSLGRRVAIQLYPDNPNLELLDFLHAAGATDPVLCYLYGSEAEDQRVIELIDENGCWPGGPYCLHQLTTGPAPVAGG